MSRRLVLRGDVVLARPGSRRQQRLEDYEPHGDPGTRQVSNKTKTRRRARNKQARKQRRRNR